MSTGGRPALPQGLVDRNNRFANDTVEARLERHTMSLRDVTEADSLTVDCPLVSEYRVTVTTTTSFPEECKTFAGPVWERWIHHPWIEALFAGELSDEQFRCWLIQDLPYLGQHIAELVFPKVPPHNPFVELQREYALQAETSRVELKTLAEVGEFARSRWSARPSRDALINFWVRTAYEGSFGYMCADLYVCYSFSETFGTRYKLEPPQGLPDLQREWVEQWIGPFEERFCQATEDGLNEYGANGTEYERDQMRWIFLHATQLQIGTFDAAWHISDPWPGEGAERRVLASAPWPASSKNSPSVASTATYYTA
jgi:thiaminase (transcriptional activator TenA)